MFFLATSSLQETFNGLTCEIKCDSGTDLLNMQLFLDLKGAHEMSKKWGSESKDKIPSVTSYIQHLIHSSELSREL